MYFDEATDPGEIPESAITAVIDDWLTDLARVDEYSTSMKDCHYLDASMAVVKNDPAALMKAYRDGIKAAMRADAINHLQHAEEEA